MASVPYTPLNPKEQEIRLLILRPGSLDKQPRCDIEVGSLKDGHFAALSYVWWDEKDRKDTIVGDQTISVTANLELALRYLQCKDLLLRIWVDALCINQSDPVEKALQVGFMSQIYSKAHTTYMWMGAPVYYSDVTIDRGDEPLRLDIFRWLNYTDNVASTLARDRIFAFLSLSFLTDTRFIKPDYSPKSDRRIFSEVTRYIMRSRVTSHDYLCPLQLRQVGKLLDLPSWVPDWTIATHHASFVPPPHGTPTYGAGQGKFWIDYEPLGVDFLGRSVQFRFSDDFETLVIR